MIESFETTVFAVTAVYLVMGTGGLLRWFGWTESAADKTLFWLIVNLLTPCLVVSKVLSNPVFADRRNLYLPPLIGFGVILFGIAAARLIAQILPKNLTGIETAKQKGTFAACAGMLNYGYVPIPLIAELFPNDDRMLGVLFVANLGAELALWTVCLFALSGTFNRRTLLGLINVPSVVILSCLALNLTGGDRLIPHFALQPASILGAATIPLSLLFIGGVIADQLRAADFSHERGKMAWVALFSCLVRLLILPLLTLCLAIFLPCTAEMKIVLVIYSGMASAVFPIAMSKMYGGDVRIAMTTVLSNTLIAFITTPLWVIAGMKILGIAL